MNSSQFVSLEYTEILDDPRRQNIYEKRSMISQQNNSKCSVCTSANFINLEKQHTVTAFISGESVAAQSISVLKCQNDIHNVNETARIRTLFFGIENFIFISNKTIEYNFIQHTMIESTTCVNLKQAFY